MEENNTQQIASNENTVKNDSTQADTKNENLIPQHRFNEVNTAKNDALKQIESLQSQIAERDAKEKQKRDADLEKQGEYKKLLDEQKAEMEKYKATASKWNQYETDKRGMLMEQLSEDRREFADGMDLIKLEKFVESEANVVKSVGTNNLPSSQGKKPGTDFGGYGSLMEWVEKDPEGYQKYRDEQTGGKFGDIFAPKSNPFANE